MNTNLSIILAMVFAGISTATWIYIGGIFFNQWFAAYEDQYVQRTEADLYGMFSNLSPQRILQVSLSCFGSVFGLTLFFIGNWSNWFTITLSLLVSAVMGLLGSFLPRLVLKRAMVLRLRKFDLQLLDALTNMSNALKAGFSIIQTFESVVQESKNPISQEFDLLLRELRLGVNFEKASENLANRVPTEDLLIVLAGIETARQTGGNLTEVFDRLAFVIRERMRVQGRIRSLTAQGRLQGWVVGLMPITLGVFMYFFARTHTMIVNFIQSGIGIILIVIMLILISIGFVLIRKIVNIDV